MAAASCSRSSCRRDERQVLVGEIEPGLEVAEQVQQGVAEPVQRPGQPAGQLRQGDVEFVRVGGVDHAEHGFGLRQVDPAGEKRPQRELARLGQSRPGRAALTHDGLQQRRRADRVQFGDRPARVAATGRPEVQFGRQTDCGRRRGGSNRRPPWAGRSRPGDANRWSLAAGTPVATHRSTSGPLSRTIPSAAPPGADAIATIVSSRWSME